MKLSVVIPTYNRRDVLARTLATLFAQDFAPDEYEVVVAVDGSSDGTGEFLRTLKPPCSLHIIEHDRNRGQAAACNSGLGAAQGELVLFIDDDMLCDRALVRQHVVAHQDNPAAVVAGPVIVAPESRATLASDRMREVYIWRDKIENRIEIHWCDAPGANTSVARSLVSACGGFDESLFQMYLDIDLNIRLCKMGARFYYEPRAVAHTIYVKTIRDLLNDAAWQGRNYVVLSRKEPAFRPYHFLAGITRGGSLKRLVRKAIACSPLSPGALLGPALWIAEKLRGSPLVRRGGVRLLQGRMNAVACRTAVREAGGWAAFRCEFGMRLPVLLYHRVSPRPPTIHPQFTVPPEQFEREIGWLSRHGYVGIRPSDWLEWIRQGTPLPARPVLITFDDGYEETAEYAFPILRRYGFRAAAYLVTGRVGDTNVWDQARGCATYRLMDAEGIRYWAAQGIEFGSHSRTHPDLTRLTGAQLREEVFGSRQDLEDLLRERPLSFAYPHGLHDDTVRSCVKNAFALAFTSEHGVNHLRTESDSLVRTFVRPGDLQFDLECRVRFGWSPVEEARVRMRRALGSIRRGVRRRSRDRQPASNLAQ